MPHLLTVLRRRGYRYLLGPFRFTTDEAAPMTSPHAESGGSLTLVQTDGQFSASSGALVFPAQSTPNWGDQSIAGAVVTRAAGKALLATLRYTATGYNWIGFNDDATPGDSTGATFPGAIRADSGNITVAVPGASSVVVGASFATATTYDVLLVMCGTGIFIFLRGGVYTTWTRLWVGNTGTANGYPSFSNYSGAGTLDMWRVVNLAAYDSSFATDEGQATDRKATNSAGDTIVMLADAWVEQTLMAATGVTKDLYVRWTDDSNCWIVRQDQVGSTCKLVEVVAGVETVRVSAAQTFSNGASYRMIAVCDGTTITVYVQVGANIARIGAYASATTNQTAVAAKAPSAGSEFKAYSRTISLPGGL